MKIAIVTAGGAGMFCGSCMHDNTWAQALLAAGHDVTLLPLYTPIRVDTADQTSTPVFLGGINLYLNQHLPGWKWLPNWLKRPFDAPWLLKAVSRRGLSNHAAELGEMTVAMLKGPDGPQAAEGKVLVDFLAEDLRPEIIVFSNLMLCAEVVRLKPRFAGKIYCTLQGDDVFLDALPEPYQHRVYAQLRQLAQQLDGFLVHSRFYVDTMGTSLAVPRERFHALPLAIDVRGHTGEPRTRAASEPATIGYFARLAPEKGLLEFVQAAVALNQRRQDFRIVTAGYEVPQHREYIERARRLGAALGERFVSLGSPETLAEKSQIYQQFHLLSVPAPYREPKGLYVLEAWANGVPVVQPDHGHFPELMAATGGGECVPPGDPQALASAWERLLDDEPRRFALAHAGWTGVRERHDLPAIARATEELFRRALSSTGQGSRDGC
jgi:glycosyltransferase involved in cell wall biosynthesis